MNYRSLLRVLCIIFCVALMPSLKVHSQDKSSDRKFKVPVDMDNFSAETMSAAILKKINDYRIANKLDSLVVHDTLFKAANDQALFMKKEGVVMIEGDGKKKNTGKRVQFFGGSQRAMELVLATPVAKGKDAFTYDSVASAIVSKWIAGKKTVGVVINPAFIFTGIGAAVDPESKKVYVSQVFGNHYSFNAVGPTKKKELTLPYTASKLKKPEDEKICRNCEKYRDIEKLHEGLYVENNKIYFKHENLKALLKLIKGSGDGFAVDVVQKAQYPCEPYNIYDNNLMTKGILLKAKYKSSLLKKNRIKEPKPKALDVELGILPKELTGDYELNLFVIQAKRVCRTVTRKFTDEGAIQSATPIDLIPDTIMTAERRFVPTAESNVLTFVVPFDKAKFEYKHDDIVPIIKSLDEPDFIVDNILISAFSSIEGDSVKNAELQRKRAESIVKAIEFMQKAQSVKEIKTADSWEQFQADVKGTKYESLAAMSKEEANKTMFAKGWNKGLEPILSKGRFAQVVMDITYDIKGTKEMPYVIKTLHKAIVKGEVERALSIQSFAIKKIIQKEYPANFLDTLKIPNEAKFASLLLNQLWIKKYIRKERVNDDHCEKVYELLKMAPSAPALVFNSLYCNVKTSELLNKAISDDVQRKIDGLYSTNLSKHLIDGLNLEHQFRVLEAMDTLEFANDTLISETITRIKKIYKVEDASTWQNSLKLAYIFMRYDDHDYAVKLLEPFVSAKVVDEKLIFAYISACSYFPYKIQSPKFVNALKKAKEINKNKYCQLFGQPFLTFQVLDNPLIKEEYCKTCK